MGGGGGLCGTPSVGKVLKTIRVCAHHSDIRYSRKQRGARGRSAVKSRPDYVGVGGGGKRAVSALTFYTKGFTNVSQASVCVGIGEKKR